MKFLNFSISDWVSITQIFFYCSTSILAFLTYWNARRGFFSPVFTEFKKRQLDRLLNISDELLEFVDMGSLQSQFRFSNSVIQLVKQIQSETGSNTPLYHSLVWDEKHQRTIPQPEYLFEIGRRADMIKTDPLIPPKLRNQLYDFYSGWYQTASEVCNQAFGDYYQQWLDSEKNDASKPSSLWNSINQAMPYP